MRSPHWKDWLTKPWLTKPWLTKPWLTLVIRYGSLPMLCLGLGLWGLYRCRSAPIVFEHLSPLPQYQKIQVYFNHNPVESYRDPYRHFTRQGDNLEQIIVEQIESAKSQVDVAVQELRSPLIAKALRDRHRQGVKVRVILENTYSRPWSDYSEPEVAQLDEHLQARYQENLRLIDQNQDQTISRTEALEFDALKIIRSAQIPWIDDQADGSKGSGLMHHKFVLIDGQTVVATSANLTLSDLHGDIHLAQSRGNANSLVVIQSSAVAKAFTEEFELMWGDGPRGAPDSLFGVPKPHRSAQAFTVGEAQVWLKFSPDSASVPWEQTTNGLIAERLQQGRSQINLALFVFSDQKLANTLAIAHRHQVKIRALIDPSFAFRPYSEALDLLGVSLPQSSNQPPGGLDNACKLEPDNQVWLQPITTVGTPKLTPGDLLHHKFAVIDEAVVIMGSHNWSEAANDINDETLVVISHPMVAAHYQREFDRLYTNSRLGVPQRIQLQWQAYRDQCVQTLAPAPPGNDPARINVNTATQEQLETLPSIGPKTAAALIEARQTQPFTSLDDLDRVPGIGEKTLAQLRDRIQW